MDLQRLFAMWTAGATKQQIAVAFGVSTSTVQRWQVQHKLPRREYVAPPVVADPTPEELEQRKAAMWRRHLEQLRAEHPDVTRVRVARRRAQEAT